MGSQRASASASAMNTYVPAARDTTSLIIGTALSGVTHRHALSRCQPGRSLLVPVVWLLGVGYLVAEEPAGERDDDGFGV